MRKCFFVKWKIFVKEKNSFSGLKKLFCVFRGRFRFLNLIVGKFAEDVMGRMLVSDIGCCRRWRLLGAFPPCAGRTFWSSSRALNWNLVNFRYETGKNYIMQTGHWPLKFLKWKFLVFPIRVWNKIPCYGTKFDDEMAYVVDCHLLLFSNKKHFKLIRWWFSSGFDS